MFNRSLALLVIGLTLLAVSCRAQQVQVTPNPAPLNSPLTISGTGFPANSPLNVIWDNPKPTSPQGNVYLTNAVSTNASGAFTLQITQPVLNFYPANAGSHTLTFVFLDPRIGDFNGVTAPVTLTPRPGWPAPQPIPTGAQNRLSGGSLAYLRFAPDGNSTSIVVNDGQTERVIGTAPLGLFAVGQPDWSPDGTRVAFPATFDTVPDTNLYVLDVRTGAMAQATALGGGPPVLTGGGVGAVTGGVLPYLPQVSSCIGTDGIFPKGAFVSLVGTGVTLQAPLPPGAQDGQAFPFRFDNVPEGDYSLHMWTNSLDCLKGSVTGVTANLTIPVHVTAGQVTQLQPIAVIDQFSQAQSVSWINNGSLAFVQTGGVFMAEIHPAVSDVWSVNLGQAAMQHSETIKVGQITEVDSHPNFRLISGQTSSAGLFLADPTDVANTVQLMTSWQAVFESLFQQTGGVAPSDHNPSWDPQGSHIAFIRQIPQVNQNVGGLFIYDVANGIEREVARFNLQGGEGAYGRPAWSPDRSQIAITYTNDNLKTYRVRVVNVADGSSFDLTTDGRSGLPTWSGTAPPLATLANNAAVQPRITLPPPPQALPGDFNGDGKVTVGDAITGLRFAVGLDQPTEAQIKIGDLNNDGKITVQDITGLLRKAVGL